MSSSKRRAREIFIRLYTKLCPMYDHKIFLIYLVPDNSLKLTLLEASKKIIEGKLNKGRGEKFL